MTLFERKYATGAGADVYVPMTKAGVVDFAVGADWTPAAGDVMVGPPDTYALQPGDRRMLISNEGDMEQLGRTSDATAATSSDQPKP